MHRGPRPTGTALASALFALIAITPLFAADKPRTTELPVEYYSRRKWIGDFDAIAKRRYMRVLVVNSQMLYFVDRGRQAGVTYETFKRFEDEVNRERKNPRLRFHVVFIPVSRDQLIPRLVAGFGDVAAGNLTVTPARASRVAFKRSSRQGSGRDRGHRTRVALDR
jgi:membrane-bound lytic murein transglycosylase MltF